MPAPTTSRFSLWALGFTTVVAAVAFVAMLFAVDPALAETSTFAAFYASLFVAASGVAAWGFLLVRGRFGRVRRPLVFFFAEALRQGAIVGAIVAASLALQARGQLTILSAAAMVAAALAIEAFGARRMRALA